MKSNSPGKDARTDLRDLPEVFMANIAGGANDY